MTAALLKSLNLSKKNAGASTGMHWWSKTKKSGEIISYNPSTGQPIAAIYKINQVDYEYAIKEARVAFVKWRDVPAPKRGEVIHAIGMALRQYKRALGRLVSLEMGKSIQEGVGEVQEMIDMADFAVGLSRMLYGKTMPSERIDHRLCEVWHPLGIVSVVTAFNFPVAVWAWNALIAAVCGNTVIWKPSPKTSLAAIAVQHICNRVCHQFGYRGIFSLLVSDETELVKNMASDNRIALLSFTGSTEAGRIVNELVAKRLGKSILELSGNNGAIIDKGTDLSRVLSAVAFSAMGTAGQRCTTLRRLFVHESDYEKCIDKLIPIYKQIKIGDPLNKKNLVGPLIDKSAVAAFEKTIVIAKQSGGKILSGGKALKHPGYFVEPTLIKINHDCDCVQQETFAPILYIMTYQTFEEAILLHNASCYGLSSALFTNDLAHAEWFLSARGSDCGIANINIGTSGAEIGGAFGGEKSTGGGREAGSDAWKAYMRRQTNTVYWGQTLTFAQGVKFAV